MKTAWIRTPDVTVHLVFNVASTLRTLSSSFKRPKFISVANAVTLLRVFMFRVCSKMPKVGFWKGLSVTNFVRVRANMQVFFLTEVYFFFLLFFSAPR